jgi:hypothetical protein
MIRQMPNLLTSHYVHRLGYPCFPIGTCSMYVMPDLVSAFSEYFVIRNETHFKPLSAEQSLVLSFVINDVRIF